MPPSSRPKRGRPPAPRQEAPGAPWERLEAILPPDPYQDSPRWQHVAPGLYWDLLGRRIRKARPDGSPPPDPPRRPPPTCQFVTGLIRKRQRLLWRRLRAAARAQYKPYPGRG